MSDYSKLVYVAGPYRSATEFGVFTNIESARALSVLVWQAGAVPIVPHLNSAFMGGVVPDSAFLKAGLTMLEKCDAMILVNGWTSSEGTIAEIAHAYERGIPVFETLVELRAWLESSE